MVGESENEGGKGDKEKGGDEEAGGREKKRRDKRMRMRVWERWWGLKEKWGRPIMDKVEYSWMYYQGQTDSHLNQTELSADEAEMST